MHFKRLALLGTLPIVLLILSLFSQARLDRFFMTTQQRAANCDGVLKAGRHLDEARLRPQFWQPDGCTLHDYAASCARDPHYLAPCLQPGDEILFLGDSTGRQVFLGMCNTLEQGTVTNVTTHERLSKVVNGITLTFMWTEFLNKKSIDELEDIAQHGMDSKHKTEARSQYDATTARRPPKTYLVVTAGLWFVRDIDPHQVETIFTERLQRIIKIVDGARPGVFEPAYCLPTMMPYFPQFSGRGKKYITPAGVGALVRATDKLFGYERGAAGEAGRGGVLYKTEQPEQPLMYYVPVIDELGGENHPGLSDKQGAHFTVAGCILEARLILNHMCNQAMAGEGFSGTCCVEYAGLVPWRVGTIVLVLAGLAAWKRDAVLVLAVAATTCYVYFAERTHAFPRVEMVYDGRDLAVLSQAIVFAGLLSATREAPKLPVVRELQGLFALGALAINATGFGRVLHTLHGAELERVLVASWSALQVYSNARDLAESEKPLVLCTERLAELLVLCTERLAELLVLPVLLALSTGAGLAPLAVGQVLWCAAAGLAVLAGRVVQVLIPSKPHAARTIHVAELAAAACMGLLLLLPFVPFEKVRRDFWVCFVALGLSLVALPPLPWKPLKLLHVATLLALLASALLVRRAAPVADLAGSRANPSAVEANAPAYAESIDARACSVLVHTAVCIALLLLAVAVRTALLERTPVYAGAYLAVARCAYELLLLSNHVLSISSTRLYLLPGGTGAILSGITQRALGLYPITTPYRMLEYPGAVLREMAQFVNLGVVAAVCGVAAAACAPQMYRRGGDEGDVKADEKGDVDIPRMPS